MIAPLLLAVFFAGLAAIGWVGAGYLGTNPFALGVTALIAALYLAGAFELRRFHAATAALARAIAQLHEAPTALGAWLEGLPPALQPAVRRRIEGEPAGLAGPALAPSLAGLLVLFGMLGTFIGMVFTLRGTGVALESAADLQTVRASLVAPVRGLGLAFGTSVAGVAASAALGLLSALCRRERTQAAQALDGRIATTLRGFSAAHGREASLHWQQRQAEAMPALVDRLQSLIEAIERRAEAADARQRAAEEAFHARAEAAYAALASSVDRSLKESLGESARIAGATIRPVAEATMGAIAEETAALRQVLTDAAQKQGDELGSRLEATAAGMAHAWEAAAARQEASSRVLCETLGAAQAGFVESLERRSVGLLDNVSQRQAEWQQELGTALASVARETSSIQQQIAQTTAQQLDGVTARLEDSTQRMSAAWREALALQQRQHEDASDRAQHELAEASAGFERHAAALLRGVNEAHAELLQDAAKAPRAAAEAIAALHDQLADRIVRDNALLEERGRMLETLTTLLEAVNRAAGEQRGAIDALVQSAAAMLDRAGSRFGEQVDAQAGQLAQAAARMAGGAVEVASLGESFGTAVELFRDANGELVAQLQRIENALGKTMSRSDEQLAYYVAQAREVVDLSILSQRQIIEELQRLGDRVADPAGAPA